MRKACLNAVYQLAQEDPRVVFIGSDLGPGTLAEFHRDMPDRFFMEGISEQHIIGMAAGLALSGHVPYVNTIATFVTRRCYEQVAIDLCLQNLPVRLIGNGGGLVYAPLGPTHLATDDLALMTALPNMTVVAPSDAKEMAQLMPQLHRLPGPAYVRLAKGGDPIVARGSPSRLGMANPLTETGRVQLLTTGIMAQRALATRDMLMEMGVSCGVLHLHTVKPLDQASIVEWVACAELVVVLEEHSEYGGLGPAVLKAVSANAPASLPRVRCLALPDAYPKEYGTQDGLLERYGLAPQDIVSYVISALNG